MRLTDFDYNLPAELIAQEPPAERGNSRLLLVDRAAGTTQETAFGSVVSRFRPGDLLVMNDTRVIPARLTGTKESGGHVEVFLVRRVELASQTWKCLVRASKSPKPGSVLCLAEGRPARVIEKNDDGTWLVEFPDAEDFDEWLERSGSMPLPPYIRRPAQDDDRERYQTVFARVPGAVAAPTAGLHMTPEILHCLRAAGVRITTVTLHVGLGTFMPVRVDDLRDHRMHREYYRISDEAAREIEETRQQGGRVVALGTTVCRTLEHAVEGTGRITAGEGEADIFIYPGHEFAAVDALITNFHLPKSTLLMLVSAFAGKELLFRAYAEAVTRKFRFFSYGDAMMIE